MKAFAFVLRLLASLEDIRHACLAECFKRLNRRLHLDARNGDASSRMARHFPSQRERKVPPPTRTDVPSILVGDPSSLDSLYYDMSPFVRLISEADMTKQIPWENGSPPTRASSGDILRCGEEGLRPSSLKGCPQRLAPFESLSVADRLVHIENLKKASLGKMHPRNWEERRIEWMHCMSAILRLAPSLGGDNRRFMEYMAHWLGTTDFLVNCQSPQESVRVIRKNLVPLQPVDIFQPIMLVTGSEKPAPVFILTPGVSGIVLECPVEDGGIVAAGACIYAILAFPKSEGMARKEHKVLALINARKLHQKQQAFRALLERDFQSAIDALYHPSLVFKVPVDQERAFRMVSKVLNSNLAPFKNQQRAWRFDGVCKLIATCALPRLHLPPGTVVAVVQPALIFEDPSDDPHIHLEISGKVLLLTTTVHLIITEWAQSRSPIRSIDTPFFSYIVIE